MFTRRIARIATTLFTTCIENSVGKYYVHTYIMFVFYFKKFFFALINRCHCNCDKIDDDSAAYVHIIRNILNCAHYIDRSLYVITAKLSFLIIYIYYTLKFVTITGAHDRDYGAQPTSLKIFTIFRLIVTIYRIVVIHPHEYVRSI